MSCSEQVRANLEAASAFEERAALLKFEAAKELSRPSVLFRPSIGPDGDMWCALYGSNLMEGVAGFGQTPDAAMRDFDANWYSEKTPAANRQATS